MKLKLPDITSNKIMHIMQTRVPMKYTAKSKVYFC